MNITEIIRTVAFASVPLSATKSDNFFANSLLTDLTSVADGFQRPNPDFFVAVHERLETIQDLVAKFIGNREDGSAEDFDMSIAKLKEIAGQLGVHYGVLAA